MPRSTSPTETVLSLSLSLFRYHFLSTRFIHFSILFHLLLLLILLILLLLSPVSLSRYSEHITALIIFINTVSHTLGFNMFLFNCSDCNTAKPEQERPALKFVAF